jgi:hypothetical protein
VADDLTDDPGRLAERQGLRTGQLENPSHEVVVEQRPDAHRGDVGRVDEPLPGLADRHGQPAPDDGVAEERLEVLVEPVGPHDRPLGELPDGGLGLQQPGDTHDLGAAVGVQHDPFDPGRERALHEALGQSNVVGKQQVGTAHAGEHRVPGARVRPVEPRGRMTAGRPHGNPLPAQLVDHPAADGAGASEDKDRVSVVDVRHDVVPLV